MVYCQGGTMKRKTAAILLVAFFILPMLAGLGFDGYHRIFHKHQDEAQAWYDAEVARENARTKKLLEQKEPIAIIFTSDWSSARYHIYEMMRESNRCWMEKYTSFVMDVTPGWMVFMIFWAYFIFPRIPFRDDFEEGPEPVPV